MKIFCDHIREDVTVERRSGEVIVQCRYFQMIPKGPACKRVIFGRIGFPILTPKSAAKTIFRMVNMAVLDAVKISLGMGARITWHCSLYFEKPPGKGSRNTIMESTLSVLDAVVDAAEAIDRTKK